MVIERYKLEIVRDEGPASPLDDVRLGTIISWHRDFMPEEDGRPWVPPSKWEKEHPDVIKLPLYLLDHSGYRVNTTGYNLVDPGRWDWGQIGWIYVTVEKARKEGYKGRGWRKKVESTLEAEVKIIDQYLSGEVWGWRTVENETGNVKDACYGYYNRKECEEDGKRALAWVQEVQFELDFNGD